MADQPDHNVYNLNIEEHGRGTCRLSITLSWEALEALLVKVSHRVDPQQRIQRDNKRRKEEIQERVAQAKVKNLEKGNELLIDLERNRREGLSNGDAWKQVAIDNGLTVELVQFYTREVRNHRKQVHTEQILRFTKAGLSIRDIAARIGIPKSTISNWLSKYQASYGPDSLEGLHEEGAQLHERFLTPTYVMLEAENLMAYGVPVQEAWEVAAAQFEIPVTRARKRSAEIRAHTKALIAEDIHRLHASGYTVREIVETTGLTKSIVSNRLRASSIVPDAGEGSRSSSGDRARRARREGLDASEAFLSSPQGSGREGKGEAVPSLPAPLPTGEVRGRGGKAPTLRGASGKIQE